MCVCVCGREKQNLFLSRENSNISKVPLKNLKIVAVEAKERKDEELSKTLLTGVTWWPRLPSVWGVWQSVVVGVRVSVLPGVTAGGRQSVGLGATDTDGLRGWRGLHHIVCRIQLHHCPLLASFLTARLAAAVENPLDQLVDVGSVFIARAVQGHLTHTHTAEGKLR